MLPSNPSAQDFQAGKDLLVAQTGEGIGGPVGTFFWKVFAGGAAWLVGTVISPFTNPEAPEITEDNTFVTPLDDGTSAGGNVTTFPEGEIVVGPPGGFDLGQATEIDPETFPDSNQYLQDLLDGNYEFPLAGEQGPYFLAAETNETLIGLIDSSTPGTETMGRAVQYDTPGDFERANEVFDSLELSNVRPLTNSQFNGRIGELDDGRTVIVRDRSKGSDQPTLEIQSGKNRLKFRFLE